MCSRKNKATAALVFSTLLFIVVYPYQGSFFGGLLLSACLAAVIGGLADWFAVTALFRKPMGISYRTEVIPRNRERLFHEMIRFIADDLLTVDNIGKIVQRYDMAELMVAFLNDSNGKEKIKRVTHVFIEKLFVNFDFRIIAEKIALLLQQSAHTVEFSAVFNKIFAIVKANKYDDKIVVAILGEIIAIVRDEKISYVLADLVDRMKLEYEGDLARRQLMSFAMNLSSHKLAVIAQDELLKYLEGLQDPLHPQRQRLSVWLEEKSDDPEFMAQLEAWKDKLLEEQWKLADRIELYLENSYRGAQIGQTIAMTINCFDKIMEEKFLKLESNTILQQDIDIKIKETLYTLIHGHHEFIVEMVDARLRDFSDSELVEFIEERVADDLQMIRINGSLVGSLVGMLLYLVTYAAERMWL